MSTKCIRLNSDEFAEYLNEWENSPFTFTAPNIKTTYIGAKILLTVNPHSKGEWTIIIRENNESGLYARAYAFVPDSPDYKKNINKLFEDHGWDYVIVHA